MYLRLASEGYRERASLQEELQRQYKRDGAVGLSEHTTTHELERLTRILAAQMGIGEATPIIELQLRLQQRDSIITQHKQQIRQLQSLVSQLAQIKGDASHSDYRRTLNVREHE